MSTKKETEEGVILVPNPQVLQQIDAQRQIAEVNHLLREQEMQRLRRMTPMQQPQMIPSMEAIRRLAFDLQKTLIPGAEDVELIGQMISLIEETATYLYLVAYKQKQTPQLPCFYGSSFYYLYKLAIKRGQRPIYLYHLAEIAKLRVQETLPGIGDKIVFPSLKEVVEHFQRFEKGGGPELTSKKQLAESLYEKVLGEAYNYIQKHHAILMAAPKSVNFLIRFLILFHNFNAITGSMGGFGTSCFQRLHRHLVGVDPKFIEQLHINYRTALKLPSYYVCIQ